MLKIEMYASAGEHFLWALPWTNNMAFMVGFGFSITNQGTQSIEDVAIELLLPSVLYIPGLPRNCDEGIKLVDVQRDVETVNDLELTRLLFKIPIIHPNVKLSVMDDVFLPGRSRFESAPEALANEDSESRSIYDIPAAWNIKFSVTARDLRAARRLFKLFSYTVDDKNLELLDDSEKAMKALKDNYRGGPIIPSMVLTAKNLRDAPAHVQAVFPMKLKRVHAHDIMGQSVMHFCNVGYVPGNCSLSSPHREGSDGIIF